MPLFATNCPHNDGPGDLKIVEEIDLGTEQLHKCNSCDNNGPNLWLCLNPDCRYVGCDEKQLDHSSSHYKKNPQHTAQMHLSSNRIWCYSCESEMEIEPVNYKTALSILKKCVAEENKSMDQESAKLRLIWIKKHLDEFKMLEGKQAERGDYIYDRSDDYDASDVDEGREFSAKPRGLVGLQNIGNTCYMNSALQALSNIPPLTRFFLECGQVVSFVIKDKKETKQPLCISYSKLLKDMWSRESRSSIVPHALLTGIRVVQPMFRGYHQQDAQEFLRYFMDQLHEELKEHIEDDREASKLKSLCTQSSDDEETEVDGTGSSQSDGEYETCDSGVSEQSSLSDEGADHGSKQSYSKVSQADKLRNAFVNRNSKKTLMDATFAQQSSSSRSGQTSPLKGSSNNPRTKKQIKSRSIISDIFDGKLLSSVKCLSCDRISTRVETFQDLSLPIPSRDHIDMLHQGSITPQKANPCSDVVYVSNQASWISWIWQWMRSWFWGPVVSLHDCLSAFFSADELKGDNMYSCEKCNKLRNGTKFSEVLELPEVLLVHLKRLRHELMFSSKIASYVSFPLKGLDMRSFVHKECRSEVTSYDLVSVICHHGTATGGHYICYALNQITNQWFEFDDSRVTRVSSEVVQNCEAYVLFYKKSSKEMTQVRERAVELMEMSAKDPLDLSFFVSRQWINRLNTFAEPGPIDNSDFLCPHGGIDPLKKKYVDNLSISIPQNVWEFLYETFGGGPACSNLYECTVCEEKCLSLQNRRTYELEMYHELNRNIESTTMYALSMSWFRQWQDFIKGKEIQPPGQIDNSSIVVNKGNQNILKAGSDYGAVPEEVWQFFESTYNGGPELMLPSASRPMPAQSTIPVHSTTNPNVVEHNAKIRVSRDSETRRSEMKLMFRNSRRDRDETENVETRRDREISPEKSENLESRF